MGKNYNGQIQSVRRRYDSLRNFVGKNEVYRAGDILCVSTKNDDVYDLFIDADGIHTFIELYKEQKDGGSGGVPTSTNSDGHVNTFDEIVAFLEGMPEGSDLKTILAGINTENLTEEEKSILEDLVSSGELTEEELDDEWQQAMNNAMNGGGTQEAGAGEGDDTGDGPGLDEI